MTLDDHLYNFAGKYTAAPQWVKTIAGGAYATLPPAVRFGAAYISFKERFLSDAGLAEYAAGRLGQTLAGAVSTVPAFAPYRELLGTIERDPYAALLAMPLTTKEDIKLSLPEYLSSAHGARARMQTFTGGSTSVPMTLYLQRGISRSKEWAAFRAMAERFGTDGEGVVLALRGRTVSSAGRGRIWSYEPIKRHLIVSSDHLEPRYMSAYVEALRHRPPSYIHAFPSALFPLVVWLRDNGLDDLLAGVKGVLLTSESVFEHHMAAFKAFFRCPVVAHYGHTERVLFANTLSTDTRYHFWPHYGHLELLSVDGRPVSEPGQVGEIVGTSFDNAVMPFIRYRTGDYAVLSKDGSPGLTGWPVVKRIEGRLQEFVVCHDHRLVTVTTLGAAHFEQLERCMRIQYEQNTPGRLKLRVVPINRLSDADCAAISRAVREKTQGGCDVAVEQVDSIPVTERGKQRLLIQHLDISRYLGATIEQPTRVRPSQHTAAAAALSLSGGRAVLMVGTSSKMRGGIAAVVSSLIEGGLFDRIHARYVATHVDGTVWMKLGRFARGAIETLKLLRSGDYAVMHAHVSSHGSFWRKSILLALARHYGLETVFHLHSGGFDKFAESGFGGPLLRWWIRRSFLRSSVVVVLSSRWRDWVVSFAPGCRVEVVGNPVKVPVTRPDNALRESAKGIGGRVLYLGKVCELKGCWDLLAAWAIFRQGHPHWRLAIGGNGEIERLLAHAKALSIRDDIDYLGWVTGDNKDQELGRADIFVLPSYAEGMPVAVLEAMACGAAVICTPVGGVPDMMVSERHGLWVAPGQVGEIEAALTRLADDASLRRRLAASAYAHVLEENSVQVTINRLLGIYEAIDHRAAAGSSPRVG